MPIVKWLIHNLLINIKLKKEKQGLNIANQNAMSLKILKEPKINNLKNINEQLTWRLDKIRQLIEKALKK